ncbi:hypothetical protein N476_25195 [Pseudoalteromonas luteoviolacea H33]|uniref:Uncharacterized protein n=1 Tax=Pseudoalteromonas luteoviolacea H33 TaxID=1365251 RepID=A0A167ART4_9GAMM|nr:hypothetical protein N476_25195 [Pseudoalteromonas luteoviolacea H33]KZN73982.1 hypothetical protein N477_22570 [Pseudoalteromonas luteoviolacea H33-S]
MPPSTFYFYKIYLQRTNKKHIKLNPGQHVSI